MPELLRIPEVAAGTTEAVLTSWPLAENTPYAKGDVIATVETEVSAGEPIALIGALGESVENIDAALAALGASAAAETPAGPASSPTEPSAYRAAPAPS